MNNKISKIVMTTSSDSCPKQYKFKRTINWFSNSILLAIMLFLLSNLNIYTQAIEIQSDVNYLQSKIRYKEGSRNIWRKLAEGDPTSQPSSQPSAQPSRQPTSQPSHQPSAQPSRQPTSQPSQQPSAQPSRQPSQQPTSQPSAQPSRQPTSQPSQQPSAQPSRQPSQQPTSQPSTQPSRQPSSQPSQQPTVQPSSQPTRQPSSPPSGQPTGQPSAQPSRQPTSQPSDQPTGQPSAQPSRQPTSQPSGQPSSQPTCQPSGQPSRQPSTQPTRQPTSQPSAQPTSPTSQPSAQPSTQPTAQPTQQPSRQPTLQPSGQPSTQPTLQPSCQPSSQPSTHPSVQPTSQPSRKPSTQPTVSPSCQPTMQPSAQPTCQPVQHPTAFPTSQPSAVPSTQPTLQPSHQPTGQPSSVPTTQPSTQPSRQPSSQPSAAPSNQPTSQPSRQPSAQPSEQPSSQPTSQPSTHPSAQPSTHPSAHPTSQPSTQPSNQPSSQPTSAPSGQPSALPTMQPSTQPSQYPSSQPTVQPTQQPSTQPSSQPSTHPSTQPSSVPTTQPSVQPSMQPSTQPSSLPSTQPSSQPSSLPTTQPSAVPSMQPTSQPSALPSTQPSTQPSSQPTGEPTAQPSTQPSVQPSTQPSTQPSALPTMQPSTQPTAKPSLQPSSYPTTQPSTQPSSQPTTIPTTQPSIQPSTQPSSQPTTQPTTQPSSQPTMQPTSQPSGEPTGQPSTQPSTQPSSQPTTNPTSQPSVQPSTVPSTQPSSVPTTQPSIQPSSQPSNQPTSQPSIQPSTQPSSQPSMQPSSQPTSEPTAQPSAQPTQQPTTQPSAQPSSQPSVQPSTIPTTQPSEQPSTQPTTQPSSQPSSQPTQQPTIQPSTQPSTQPSSQPSAQPTAIPSSQPSTQPSSQPTSPTSQPSSQPSAQPSSQPTYLLKVLHINMHVSSIVQFKSALNAVTVEWNELPEDSITVHFTFKYINTTTSSGSISSSNINIPTLIPSSLTLSDQSPRIGSSNLVLLSGTTLGNYQLLTTLTGPSMRQYRISNEGHQYIRVTTATTIPTVPILRSAIFSFHGIYVIVSFDSATNKGGYSEYFSCHKLLSFAGMYTARCLWKDTTTMHIIPKYNSKTPSEVLNIYSTITLLPNTIKAACDLTIHNISYCNTWETMNTTTIVISAPTTPTKPIPSLSMPSTITQCSSLTIDLTASTGSAGRPWQRIGYDITVLKGTNSAGTVLLSYLQANSSTNRIMNIPNTFLYSDTKYHIQVTLCNFLLGCNYAAKVVSVTSDTMLLPTVTILGSNPRTVSPKDTVSFNSIAYTQSCSGSITSSNMKYIWSLNKITTTTSSGSSSSISSVKINSTSIIQSQDPSIYKLPPYILTSTNQYILNLTVISLVSSRSASDLVNIIVKASTIIPKISSGLLTTITVGKNIIIDASNSIDPDRKGLTGNKAGLKYEWKCIQKEPIYSPNCSIHMNMLSTVITDRVNITATTTAIDTINRITVIVYDSNRIRSSSIYTDVITVALPVPVLHISAKQTTTSTIDVHRNVVLYGSILTTQRCTAQWSISDTSIQLTKIALTDVSRSITTSSSSVGSSTSGSSIPFTLVLASNSLNTGSSYTFTLHCGSTYTSLLINTNSPPLPGEFIITPTTGIEMSTIFQFTALQWIDVDLPITYQFGFIMPDSTLNMVVLARSPIVSTISTLPAGASKSSNMVNCTVRVYDIYDAVVVGGVLVKVTTVGVNIGIRQQYALNLIEQFSTSSGSSDSNSNTGSSGSTSSNTAALNKLISVVSTVFNTVNCTAAPNCTDLHRHLCSTRDQECGNCITGYIGDNNDGTLPCYPITTTSSTSGSGGSSSNTTTSSSVCTSNTDCLSYQYCDTTTNTCLSPLKQCAKNCTSHGSCGFIDIITGNTINTRCSIENNNCIAICTCIPNYSGPACEIYIDTLRIRRTARSKLISNLYNLSQIEDINPDGIATRAVNINALALRPYEISIEDANILIQLTNTTLLQANDLGINVYQDLLNVLDVSDILTSVTYTSYNPYHYKYLGSSSSGGSSTTSTSSRGSSSYTTTTTIANNYNDTEYRVMSAADIMTITTIFADIVGKNMEFGQKDEVFRYDNFHFTISKRAIITTNSSSNNGNSSSSNNNNNTITVYNTQSTTQQQETDNNIASTILYTNNNNNINTILTIKTLLLYPRIYTYNTDAFLSIPIYIDMSTKDEVLHTPSEYLSTIDYIFPFYTLQPQFQYKPQLINFTSICMGDRYRGRPGPYKHINYYYACPDSGTILHHNCTGLFGELVSYCPVLMPTCGSVSVYTTDIASIPYCSVVSYNDSYTHCRCSFDSTTSSTSSSIGSSSSSIGSNSMSSTTSRTDSSNHNTYNNYSTTSTTTTSTTTNPHRQLQQLSDTTAHFISSTGQSNIVATPAFVTADKANTYTIYTLPVETHTVIQSYRVIYFFSSLYFTFILLLFIIFYQKYYNNTQKKEIKKENNENNKNKRKNESIADIEKGINKELNITELLNRYILSILPYNYTTQHNIIKQLYIILSEHHSYLSILYNVTNNNRSNNSDSSNSSSNNNNYNNKMKIDKHILNIIKLITLINFDSFILIILYNIHIYPNSSNYCSNIYTEHKCIEKTRFFDPSESVCTWDFSAHYSEYQCRYQVRYTTVIGFVYIAICVVVIWCIVVIVLDYMYMLIEAPLYSSSSNTIPATNNNNTTTATNTTTSSGSSSMHIPYETLVIRDSIYNTSSDSSTTSSVYSTIQTNYIAWKGLVEQVHTVLRTLALQQYNRTNSSSNIAASTVVDRDKQQLQQVEEEQLYHINVRQPDIVSTEHTHNNNHSSNNSNHIINTNTTTNNSTTNNNNTSNSNIVEKSQNSLNKMCSDILLQQYILTTNTEHTLLYNNIYNLEQSSLTIPTTNTSTISTTTTINNNIKNNLYNIIYNNNQYINNINHKLQLTNNNYVGIQLLHEFVVDILGRYTKTATIYQNTLYKTYKYNTTTSTTTKIICILVLLCCNIFFLYYSIKNTINQEEKFQICYIVAVIVQISIEICIFETINCLLFYYTIPNIIYIPIQKVKNIFFNLIEEINTSYSELTSEHTLEYIPYISTYFYSSTDYLFVSQQLAQCRPELVESMIICRYKTPFYQPIVIESEQSEVLLSYSSSSDSSTAAVTTNSNTTTTANTVNNNTTITDNNTATTTTTITTILQYIKLYIHTIHNLLLTYTLYIAVLHPTIQLPILRLLLSITICSIVLFTLAASYNTIALIVLVIVVAVLLLLLLQRLFMKNTNKINPSQSAEHNVEDNNNNTSATTATTTSNSTNKHNNIYSINTLLLEINKMNKKELYTLEESNSSVTDQYKEESEININNIFKFLPTEKKECNSSSDTNSNSNNTTNATTAATSIAQVRALAGEISVSVVYEGAHRCTSGSSPTTTTAASTTTAAPTTPTATTSSSVGRILRGKSGRVSPLPTTTANINSTSNSGSSNINTMLAIEKQDSVSGIYASNEQNRRVEVPISLVQQEELLEGDEKIEGAEKIEDIVLPDTVIEGAEKIEDIVLPDTVIEGDEKIEDIVLPDTVLSDTILDSAAVADIDTTTATTTATSAVLPLPVVVDTTAVDTDEAITHIHSSSDGDSIVQPFTSLPPLPLVAVEDKVDTTIKPTSILVETSIKPISSAVDTSIKPTSSTETDIVLSTTSTKLAANEINTAVSSATNRLAAFVSTNSVSYNRHRSDQNSSSAATAAVSNNVTGATTIPPTSTSTGNNSTSTVNNSNTSTSSTISPQQPQYRGRRVMSIFNTADTDSDEDLTPTPTTISTTAGNIRPAQNIPTTTTTTASTTTTPTTLSTSHAALLPPPTSTAAAAVGVVGAADGRSIQHLSHSAGSSTASTHPPRSRVLSIFNNTNSDSEDEGETMRYTTTSSSTTNGTSNTTTTVSTTTTTAVPFANSSNTTSTLPYTATTTTTSTMPYSASTTATTSSVPPDRRTRVLSIFNQIDSSDSDNDADITDTPGVAAVVYTSTSNATSNTTTGVANTNYNNNTANNNTTNTTITSAINNNNHTNTATTDTTTMIEPEYQAFDSILSDHEERNSNNSNSNNSIYEEYNLGLPDYNPYTSILSEHSEKDNNNNIVKQEYQAFDSIFSDQEEDEI